MKQAASGVCRNQRVPAQLVSTEALSAQTCLFADVPEQVLGALTFLPCPSISRLRLRGQLGREAQEQHKPKPWAVRDPPPGTQEPEPSPGDAQPTRATGRRSSRCLDSQAAERLDSGEALRTDRPRPGPAPPRPRPPALLPPPAPGSRRAPAPSGCSCPSGSAHPACGPAGPPRRVGGGGDRNRPVRSLRGSLPYSAGGSSDEVRKIQVLCWVHGCRRYTTKRKEKHDPSFRHVKKIEFPEDFISRKEALIMWNRNTRRLLSAKD
ncbi:uncharacterized protein LOC132669649 [Panthera onca]